MIKKLTNEEFNVINKLSILARMDWVFIGTDKNGNDFIYDLEENKKLTLSQGILTMDAGLTDLADYGLTQEDQDIYNNLINKL